VITFFRISLKFVTNCETRIGFSFAQSPVATPGDARNAFET